MTRLVVQDTNVPNLNEAHTICRIDSERSVADSVLEHKGQRLPLTRADRLAHAWRFAISVIAKGGIALRCCFPAVAVPIREYSPDKKHTEHSTGANARV